jgi:HD-GYP domain-containing protein (c-di-GMP phosphodiesterase class II)
MLAAALELHDPATAAHSAAVAELSRRVAARLGAGAAECEFVQHVGLVHDAGKLALDPELLAKPGRLDPSEFQLVRTHPDHGADLLMRVPGLEDLSGAVRASHERWDGLGYPAGLIGDQIPLPARIVAACDAFETMVTDKPYAPRRPYSAAIVELERCAGSRFDPLVVRALVSELTAELHHTRAAAA